MTRGQRIVYVVTDDRMRADPERTGLVAFVETHDDHVVIAIPLPEEMVGVVAEELTGVVLDVIRQRVPGVVANVSPSCECPGVAAGFAFAHLEDCPRREARPFA